MLVSVAVVAVAVDVAVVAAVDVAVDVAVEIEKVFVEAFVEMKSIILHLNRKLLVDSCSIARHTTSTILLNYCSPVNIYLFYRSPSLQHLPRLF